MWKSDRNVCIDNSIFTRVIQQKRVRCSFPFFPIITLHTLIDRFLSFAFDDKIKIKKKNQFFPNVFRLPFGFFMRFTRLIFVDFNFALDKNGEINSNKTKKGRFLWHERSENITVTLLNAKKTQLSEKKFFAASQIATNNWKRKQTKIGNLIHVVSVLISLYSVIPKLVPVQSKRKNEMWFHEKWVSDFHFVCLSADTNNFFLLFSVEKETLKLISSWIHWAYRANCPLSVHFIETNIERNIILLSNNCLDKRKEYEKNGFRLTNYFLIFKQQLQPDCNLIKNIFL